MAINIYKALKKIIITQEYIKKKLSLTIIIDIRYKLYVLYQVFFLINETPKIKSKPTKDGHNKTKKTNSITRA